MISMRILIRVAMVALPLAVVGGCKSTSGVPARAGASVPAVPEGESNVPARAETDSEGAFSWLQDLDNERTSGWLHEQDDRTRSMLDSIDGRDQLRAEVAASLGGASQIQDIVYHGGEVFYIKTPPGSTVASLFATRLEAGAGTERELVSPTEGAAIDYYAVSPDGERVAVGMAKGGSERPTLRVFTRSRKRWESDALEDVWLDQHFWLGNDAFAFLRFQTPGETRFVNTNCYLHAMGAEKNQLVLGAASEEPELGPQDIPGVYLTPASDLAWGYAGPGPKEYVLYVSPRAALRAGRPEWRQVLPRGARTEQFVAVGTVLYAITYGGTSRGQVVAVDGETLDAEPEVLVPESGYVLERIAASRDALYLTVLDAGVRNLYRFDLTTRENQRIELGKDVSVGKVSTDPRSRDALILTSSWTRGPRLLRYVPGKVVRDTGIIRNLGEQRWRLGGDPPRGARPRWRGADSCHPVAQGKATAWRASTHDPMGLRLLRYQLHADFPQDRASLAGEGRRGCLR